MNLRISDDASHPSLSNEDSLSNDQRGENSGAEQQQQPQSSYALAEVVTLKYPHSIIEGQEQFGRAYYMDDIVIFNVTVAESDNIAYLIDLYTYSSRKQPGEPPVHLGYHYILPNMLRRSDGELEIPITCATKHRPLGMMNIEFLKVSEREFGWKYFLCCWLLVTFDFYYIFGLNIRTELDKMFAV